mgnify:FL=1
MIVPTYMNHVDLGGNVTQEQLPMIWDQLRQHRNNELNNSDWRFMADQTPSQEWIDYRAFLRNLPQNFEDAWSAGDAWNQYDIPE